MLTRWRGLLLVKLVGVCRYLWNVDEVSSPRFLFERFTEHWNKLNHINMKQSTITFLLAILLGLVCVQAPAHDFEVANDDGVTIYYVFNNSEKTELSVSYRGTSFSSYSGEYSGNVVIPSSITYQGKNYPVTSIRYDAFHGCSGLTSITIPKSVTSIGSEAFEYCSGLTSVTIPEGVTSIGSSAFSGCSGLTSITIPEGVTSIGSSAFSSCRGLTSVTIPKSAINIGSSAFSGCSSLTSITIPERVTSIGIGAFSGCSGLTTIIVEEGNPKYDSRDNCKAIIETSTNILINGCKNTVVPNSVTSIEQYAFSECSGLKAINIPESVTNIGRSAFSKCNALNKVIVSNIAAWCNISFADSDSNPLYHAQHLYSDENNEITNLVVPEGITKISKIAFNGCCGLVSITLPESVTTIGDYAFARCSGLISVNIQGATSIGDYAFGGCSGLISVNIPEGVAKIGNYAFNSCNKLTSVVIPESVTNKLQNFGVIDFCA